jgi:hypothetical protein
MNPAEEFERTKRKYIQRMSKDKNLLAMSNRWFIESCKYKYSYNFTDAGNHLGS